METTKKFITIYGIFVMILFIFQLVSNTDIGFNSLETKLEFTFESIVNFVGELISVVLSIVFYTVPNLDQSVLITIVNVFLWIFRILAFIELLPYLKDLADLIPLI